MNPSHQPNAVNPEMIVVARESRGFSQSGFAQELGITQGTLSKYEAGMLPIPSEAIGKIAAVLRYPERFFYSEDRVFGFNSSVFFHRRKATIPDRVLRAIHAQINIRRFNVRRFLKSVELDSPNKFYPLGLEDFQGRPDRIAQMVRGMWHVPSGPIRNVTRLIEDAGGIVVRLDFQTPQIDAISEWVPDHPPIFFVNSCASITGDRLRMTLAHEMGHIFMHHNPSATMEDQANKFASEFLMPAREIKSSLYKLTIPKLANLKGEWLVSMAALIERAYQLKTINEYQRRYLHIQMASMGYKTREPEETDIPLEKPFILGKLVDAHLGPLGYTQDDIADAVNINREEFSEIYLGSGKLRLVS